jgi:putative transposase
VVDSHSVKSTAVGAEERGYDAGKKKVKGLKSATSWWTPRVWCSQGEGHERQGDGQRRGQDAAASSRGAIPSPSSYLWLEVGYPGEDKGKDWVEKTLGWSVDLLERAPKPAPEEVLSVWAREWAKEGVALDWEKLMPLKGFQVLPGRWVVERTFSWIDQNRRMSKDYERLCASGETFVYAAMIRLMRRRLVRT